MKKSLSILTLTALLSTSLSPQAMASQDYCTDSASCESTPSQQKWHAMTQNCVPEKAEPHVSPYYEHYADDHLATVAFTSMGAAAVSFLVYKVGIKSIFLGAQTAAISVGAAAAALATLKTALALGVVAATYGGLRAYLTFPTDKEGQHSESLLETWWSQFYPTIACDAEWLSHRLTQKFNDMGNSLYDLFIHPLPMSTKDLSGFTVENFARNYGDALCYYFLGIGVLATASVVVAPLTAAIAAKTAGVKTATAAAAAVAAQDGEGPTLDTLNSQITEATQTWEGLKPSLKNPDFSTLVDTISQTQSTLSNNLGEFMSAMVTDQQQLHDNTAGAPGDTEPNNPLD